MTALPLCGAFWLLACGASAFLSAMPPTAPKLAAAIVSISDAFDGGNGQLATDAGSSAADDVVTVHIKPDVYTELEKTRHLQYFCFRATATDVAADGGETITYQITNAGSVSYPFGWRGCTVFYTDNIADSDSWRRKLDTTYDEGVLSWTHHHQRDGSVYFSYFPPFPYYRQLDLLAQCARSSLAQVRSLGQTLEGREMDCVTVGTGSTVCWIIHRQHPGEPMAEYYAEGLLRRLLGLDTPAGEVDGLVRQLCELYTFYIVPNMNPDGSVRGHLRTNAVGANLNREWATKKSSDYKAPTLERSPEVYHVLQAMDATGVDMFLDVHGDEALPFNFLSGAEGTQHWGPRLEALHGAFLAEYTRCNSDMQQAIGYPASKPGFASGNIATNAIANRFNCLSATLEMPFKDCRSNPCPETGWSPQRARLLGASVLYPLLQIHPYLRADNEFWMDSTWPEEYAYVEPTSRY